MKLNYETCIVGETCVLVPYRPQHVEQYHGWMQQTDLLEATGSELMTLDEEKENQQSWREDETKCTFIILARDLICQNLNAIEINNKHDDDDDDGNDDDTKDRGSGPQQQSTMFSVEENIHAMVGDVNLFVSDEDNDEEIDPFAPPPEQQSQQDNNHIRRLQAEVDIMIANPEYRGKGLGKEATLLMMLYGASKIGWEQQQQAHGGRVVRYFCKINQDNVASKNMFETKLGFHVKEYIEVFQQHELELKKETNHDLIDHLKRLLMGTELSMLSCPL